jgi:hypothetical protein
MTPFAGQNMNGIYPTQMGDNAPTQIGGYPSNNWSTSFKDYPHGVEYFEVSSDDISSTYAEVYWKPLPNMPIPADVVTRFAGKGMAIVGFEADQVRTVDGKDVSLPINCAYNHHYGLNVVGAGSSMQRVKRDPSKPETMGGHDAPGPAGFVDLAVEHTPSPEGLPTSGVFGYNNGGEFRKSYHALAPPFAQVVEAPQTVRFGPMQIDTWNRRAPPLPPLLLLPLPLPLPLPPPHCSDRASSACAGDKMSLEPGSKFVPGPQPSNSFAPRSGVDAVYSGLLECPLTTRIRKQLTGGGWNDSFIATLGGKGCATAVQGGAEACYAAAQTLGLPDGLAVANATGPSASQPPGCSVTLAADGSEAHVFFNTEATSAARCGAGAVGTEGSQPTATGVILGLHLPGGGAVANATITVSGPADGNW